MCVPKIVCMCLSVEVLYIYCPYKLLRPRPLLSFNLVNSSIFNVLQFVCDLCDFIS